VKEDGRVHTHFLQAGTTTGRLASRDPNMQNIPIRGEFGKPIRAAFVAEKGYTLVAFDYSQIELRIAAFLAEDEELMNIFKRGEDIHTSVAARVFRVEQNAVTSEMRRHAKVINFGIMYGMGVNALRENLGAETTREDAQQFLNAYFESFPRLAAYLDEVKAFAYSNGYTETLYGRRRYFPGIRSTIPYMRASAERMAINAPIQGTEADIVRIAMVRVHEYLAQENLLDDVRMLLQIHDELMFEIKEERVAEVEPKLRKIMQDVVPAHLRHDVPLAVGMKQGRSWGDIE
jgi:DNA polymerase-1